MRHARANPARLCRVCSAPRDYFAAGWGRAGITKLLLSPNNSPWVLSTLLLSFLCFYGSSVFGKGTQLASVREANLIAAVFFSISYRFVGLGLGLFEKESRLSRYAVVRLNALAWFLALGITVATMALVFFMNVGRYALIFGSTGALVGNLLFYLGIIRLLRDVPHRFVVLGEQTKITGAIGEFLSSSSLGGHYSNVWQVRSVLMAQNAHRSAAREFLDWSHISDLVLTRAVG